MGVEDDRIPPEYLKDPIKGRVDQSEEDFKLVTLSVKDGTIDLLPPRQKFAVMGVVSDIVSKEILLSHTRRKKHFRNEALGLTKLRAWHGFPPFGTNFSQ